MTPVYSIHLITARNSYTWACMHAGWGLIISVTMYAVNSAHSLLMNYYFFLGLHTALHVKVGSPIMPCSLHTTRHFGACSDGSCLRSCCSCTYTWWICLATHPAAGLRLVNVCPSCTACASATGFWPAQAAQLKANTFPNCILIFCAHGMEVEPRSGQQACTSQHICV